MKARHGSGALDMYSPQRLWRLKQSRCSIKMVHRKERQKAGRHRITKQESKVLTLLKVFCRHLAHFIFTANRWTYREWFACPILQVEKLSPNKVNDGSQKALPTHWLHPKHRMSSLATEAITGILLFVEGFVFLRYFKLSTYWSFTAYHWGDQSWLFPLPIKGDRRPESAHLPCRWH